MHFKIDNIESDHTLADYRVDNFVVSNVAVNLDNTGKLEIADHKMSVSYGKVLKIGLDGAVIPLIDPTAHNLNELMSHKIDCNAVGQAIADALQIGGASAFSNACSLGLSAGANLIYNKIADIDGTALELGLAGTAKALDKNKDGSIDTILTGAWTGNMSYAGTPAPLAGATFYGARM